MNSNRWMSGLLALTLLLPGCGKQLPDDYRQLSAEAKAQRKYVNLFAWNVLDQFYLWRDEISAALDDWETWEEPIAKVAAIRYKDAKGNDIDRWTMLSDDFSSFTGNVSGHTRTLGLDFQLYYTDKTQTRICAVVTYTYAGSPAEDAGLRRGDVILTVDGAAMTPDNYLDKVRDGLYGGGTVKLGLSDGKAVSLTAIDMYEDPVHTVRILERPSGRKIGYLHYTSFTLDSCSPLEEVLRSFKQAGIDDLVLDLRYNGGGYVTTETVLASMLAPLAEVEAGSVFSREIYNEKLAKEKPDEPTCFQEGFTFKNGEKTEVISAAEANPDLPRLYVLVTKYSASASESLVCGLRPYMDVILLGERTGGKFCAGYLMDAEAWYDDVKSALEDGEYEKALPRVKNWGMYVMFARYADRDGVTLSMPDGIAPDFEVEDNPSEGIALGDPEETMLAATLDLIEGRTRSASGPAAPSLTPVPVGSHPRSNGILVGRR